MVGIVILGHGQVAPALLATGEMIVGPQEQLTAVSFEADVDLDVYRKNVAEAAQKVDTGDGVLFLADLKGGTPCNTAVMIAYEKNYRVVSGVNVPMLVALALSRQGLDMDALTEVAKGAGIEGVEDVRLEV